LRTIRSSPCVFDDGKAGRFVISHVTRPLTASATSRSRARRKIRTLSSLTTVSLDELCGCEGDAAETPEEGGNDCARASGVRRAIADAPELFSPCVRLSPDPFNLSSFFLFFLLFFTILI
jgi:hypothetical protein